MFTLAGVRSIDRNSNEVTPAPASRLWCTGTNWSDLSETNQLEKGTADHDRKTTPGGEQSPLGIVTANNHQKVRVEWWLLQCPFTLDKPGRVVGTVGDFGLESVGFGSGRQIEWSPVGPLPG